MSSPEEKPTELDRLEGLAIFELVAYTLYMLTVLFPMAQHGKHGVIGWTHVFIFSVLQIINNAFMLDFWPNLIRKHILRSVILASIGPGILLLATVGVLHEARHYHRRRPDPTFGWLALLLIHLLIFAGVVFIATGYLAGPSILIHFGNFLFLVGLVIITVLSFAALAHSYYQKLACVGDNRTHLLYAVVLTLPFLWIRVVIGCITSSAELSHHLYAPYADPLAVLLCLYVLPELLVMLILVLGGFVTQDIKEKPTEQLASEMTSRSLERHDLP